MIGFSDAAEIFVFVSGIACGIAYSRILVRQGAYGLTVAIVKRLGRIYISYALLCSVVILLVTAAMRYMGVQETFGLELDTPVHAIASALLMTGPQFLPSILLLYIVLTAIVVPPLVVAPDRYRNLALMASASIWILSQIVDTTHLIRLFFNPFAWQFLFAIGVTLGTNRERKSPTRAYVLRAQGITLLAWTTVLGALLIRVLSYLSLFDVAALRFTTEEMKANLSPLRLVHFMSVAYLVAAYFPQGSSILRFPLVGPAIKMRAHSLPVFSLSIVLTFALNLYVQIHTPPLGEWIMIDCLGFLLLALTGTALAYQRPTNGGSIEFLLG